MVDFNKLCEMDNIIAGLEIASENTRYMVQDVTDEYFSLSEKDDRERCFSRGEIKNRIALDYILEVEELIEKLVPIFNAVFDEARAERFSVAEEGGILPNTGKAV